MAPGLSCASWINEIYQLLIYAVWISNQQQQQQHCKQCKVGSQFNTDTFYVFFFCAFLSVPDEGWLHTKNNKTLLNCSCDGCLIIHSSILHIRTECLTPKFITPVEKFCSYYYSALNVRSNIMLGIRNVLEGVEKCFNV